MMQAFIVTLREGVEAALIVGIVFACLSRIGRHDLKRVVLWAVGSAFLASVAVAVVLSRFQFNQDIFEGFVMLIAAGFVLSMVWFMHRAGRTMKGQIESRISEFIGNGSRVGLFLFVFLMVLREGVETVLILSAVSLNSTALLSFLGTLAGVLVAIVFGVMFIKGSVRINLQRFFRMTSVILYFVAFQLLVSGLHELSENGVLPSSRREMAVIGPIVRNDFFFFVTILALAGLMVLFEVRRRGAKGKVAVDEAPLTTAEKRKAQWTARREKLWMTAVYSCCFLFIFLVTAQYIYAKSTTSLSPSTPVTLVGNQVAVPDSQITGDDLHRYVVNVDGTDVRFLLYRKPDGSIVSVEDACQICGPVGFIKTTNGIVCKLCNSPVAPQFVGQPGGCNPVPLKSVVSGGEVVIAANDLRAAASLFSK